MSGAGPAGNNEAPLVPELCQKLANMGADGIFIEEMCKYTCTCTYTCCNEAEHDANIKTVRDIVSAADTEIYFAGGIRRLEDVKKYLYAGASRAVLDLSKQDNVLLIGEAVSRFGADRIAAFYDENTGAETISECIAHNITLYFAKNYKAYNVIAGKAAKIKEFDNVVLGVVFDYGLVKEMYDASSELKGVGFRHLPGEVPDYMSLKVRCRNDGIPANLWEVKLNFDELTVNSDGLVPVVVQDYRTDEVLMLAYMNREAFEHTIQTRRMTYYSRSRRELWEKGLTSGHFQYVKSLYADCDRDTILAKVFQVGAACHTGNVSCFFNEIAKSDYRENNPYRIMEGVFSVILDRKEHPKEGSYTNYLFDKGIDKILKKVGEEAAEIIIAAKNPDKEEVKYEIADLLYHVMVLMAQKGVSLKEIMTELSRR